MVRTQYPGARPAIALGQRRPALGAQGAGAAGAVELLGLPRLCRQAVATPGLHAALDHRGLKAALAEIRGHLRTALAVGAHDHDGTVLGQGLERTLDLVLLGANGARDVGIRELVLLAKIERLGAIARNQLPRSLGVELLLDLLRLHRESATPGRRSKTRRDADKVSRCRTKPPRVHRERRSPA